MEHPHPIQFVSLGPGDPELITLKGFRILEKAAIIFCPGTISSNGSIRSRSGEILRQLGMKEEQISVFPLPMSKDREAAFESYRTVYTQALECYQKGMRVAIVAEGDAGFYASIHSIFDDLQKEQIPVEQIAGIPAFIAAGASSGLHIVQQEERLVVIPGVTTLNELTEYLAHGTVIVIMKLSQCVEEVHQLLATETGYQFHYFENVGTDKHYYTTDTRELIEKKFPYFSLMIIKPTK